tara:strand:+ start:90 stop:197 length:108 start_codon:yes stop_codon:yes gene_type:complete
MKFKSNNIFSFNINPNEKASGFLRLFLKQIIFYII